MNFRPLSGCLTLSARGAENLRFPTVFYRENIYYRTSQSRRSGLELPWAMEERPLIIQMEMDPFHFFCFYSRRQRRLRRPELPHSQSGAPNSVYLYHY